MFTYCLFIASYAPEAENIKLYYNKSPHAKEQTMINDHVAKSRQFDNLNIEPTKNYANKTDDPVQRT